MIWKCLCLGFLQGATCHTLIGLFGEENKKYFINSVLSTLFTFVLSFMIPTVYSLCLGHLIFIISNILLKKNFYISITTTLFVVLLEFIFIPLNHIMNEYSFGWEYILSIFLCFFLFMNYYVQNTNKIEKEWLQQVSILSLKQAIMIIFMIFIGILLNSFIGIALYQSTIIAHFIGLLFMILVFTFVYLLIYLFTYIYKYKQLEDSMNKWQKESRDYINVIRSQRHDFNFHVHAIVGLIENEEYEECRKYVTNVANEATHVNDIMPVHDAVVGSMLYNMRETARKKGTDITYDITYDMEHVVCNSFEINKILGNLIQNALDAMNGNEEKEAGIKVKIFKRRGNTVISVSNLFLGDKQNILRAFELNYSTKTKHEGIGLSMISKTVEKYGGRIYTEFDGDWVSFIVNIPNYVHFEEGKYEH